MRRSNLSIWAFLASLLCFQVNAADLINTEEEQAQPPEDGAEAVVTEIPLSVSQYYDSGMGTASEFARISAFVHQGMTPIVRVIVEQSADDYWSDHIKAAFDKNLFTTADLVYVIDMKQGDRRDKLLSILFEKIAPDGNRKDSLNHLLTNVSITLPKARFVLRAQPTEMVNAIAYTIYKGRLEVTEKIFVAYPDLLAEVANMDAHSATSGETITKQNLATWLDAGVEISDTSLTKGASALISQVCPAENIVIGKELFLLAVHLFHRQHISQEQLLNIGSRFKLKD
jgi:hypothetical protein